jgi:hypothetical protein
MTEALLSGHDPALIMAGDQKPSHLTLWPKSLANNDQRGYGVGQSLAAFVEERYSSWKSPLGKEILSGKADYDSLEKWVLENGEPAPKSGRQEMLEIILNDYLLR